MTIDLQNVKFEARITKDTDSIHVEVFAPGIGLDRDRVYGWGLKPTHGTLAERLVKAVEAGKVLTATGVGTDIHNETYLQTSCRVLGRTLNADLRRLGF
jgi:hypothetical protein